MHRFTTSAQSQTQGPHFLLALAAARPPMEIPTFTAARVTLRVMMPGIASLNVRPASERTFSPSAAGVAPFDPANETVRGAYAPTF